jgi:glucokinase
MVDPLANGTFMRAFTDKRRLSSLSTRVPVYVVLNDRAALLGAADIAREAPSHGLADAASAA